MIHPYERHCSNHNRQNGNIWLSFVDCIQSGSCLVQLLSGLQLALIKPQRTEDNIWGKMNLRTAVEIDIFFVRSLLPELHMVFEDVFVLRFGHERGLGDYLSDIAVVTMFDWDFVRVVTRAQHQPLTLFHLET